MRICARKSARFEFARANSSAKPRPSTRDPRLDAMLRNLEVHEAAASHDGETKALEKTVNTYRYVGNRVDWALVGRELETTPLLARKRWAYMRDRRRRLRLREKSYFVAKQAFLKIEEKKKKTKMDVAPFRCDVVPLAPELLWKPATSREIDALHENPFVDILPEILFDALLASVLNMLD